MCSRVLSSRYRNARVSRDERTSSVCALPLRGARCRSLKSPTGAFALAPLSATAKLRFGSACAPASPAGLAVPPRPPACSRVAHSVICAQGQGKRYAPLRSVPSLAPSAGFGFASARSLRGLWLGSNRLRHSPLLYTRLRSPPRFPPRQALPRYAPRRGANAPCSLRSSWRVFKPRAPRRFKRLARILSARCALRMRSRCWCVRSGFFHHPPPASRRVR